MTLTHDLPRGPGFWAAGACRDLPADWFHPERGESTREAKAICGACPVRAACLEYALASNQHYGIWGGTSERERRRIKQGLAVAVPVPELHPDDPDDPDDEEAIVDLTHTLAPTEPPATNGDTPVPLRTDACVNCGTRYTPVRRDQRFHSKECARAWYATHPRDETGTRQPRIRKARAAKKTPATTKHVPVPASPAGGRAGPVDVQALLGQLLAGCNHWHIEADLGDVHITISRG